MQWEGKLPHDEEVWFRYDVCFGPVILENMKRMNQLAKILTSLWLSIQIFLLWLGISMEGWRQWTGKEETATKELLESLSVRPPFWMLHLRMRSPATSWRDVKSADRLTVTSSRDDHRFENYGICLVTPLRTYKCPIRPDYLPPNILHNFCFSFLLGIAADVPREIENNEKFWG